MQSEKVFTLDIDLIIWLVESGCDCCCNQIKSLVVDCPAVRVFCRWVFRLRLSSNAICLQYFFISLSGNIFKQRNITHPVPTRLRTVLYSGGDFY